MDNQAYLDKISAKNRPVKSGGFLKSPIFKPLLIGAIAVVIFLVMLIAKSGNNNTLENRVAALQLHVDNLSTTMNTYQPSVKSSILRSNSATLKSVLSSTSSTLSNLASSLKKGKESSLDKNTKAKETALAKELEDDLFNAKINGLLDRTYARKMAYEISIITAREADIIKSVKNEDTKAALESSRSSLLTIYDSFNNFSEAKK